MAKAESRCPGNVASLRSQGDAFSPRVPGALPKTANAVDAALSHVEFRRHNRAKLRDYPRSRYSTNRQLVVASSPHRTWLSAKMVDQKLTTLGELRDWQAGSWNAWPRPLQYGTRRGPLMRPA
jgi:hypothetical protein